MRGGTLVATNIKVEYGTTVILDGLSLTVPPVARIGVVGPNGSGKSTLLRVLAGLEEPETGAVERAGTVGYLPQEPERAPGQTLLDFLARRTGVAAAAARMDDFARRLQQAPSDKVSLGLSGEYAEALDAFLALGGGDLEARAREVCAELGLRVPLDQELPTLSGGEAARVSLAALLLVRFDILCLDEPTNDLDFEGLDRLERFVQGYDGSIVLVSHDRAFLDRTVTRIVAFDAETRDVHEFAGNYEAYARQRALALERQERAHADYVVERDRFGSLLAARREQASPDVKLGRRATQALHSKVRQAERRLERLEEVEKPWRPWRLELELAPRSRSGDVVARLAGAIVQRGAFRLGPIDVEIGSGDRVAITGPNGAGKTTLLRALTGEIPLAAGTRELGPGVVLGELDQRRELLDGDEALLDSFRAASSLAPAEARTLLAKFGIRGEDALRAAGSLTPGERSRALLALLQARGVNCLILDEPTNHLDLEAIEQLEEALVDYAGTVLVVSHDRRFLERFAPTRTIDL
jgi:ATPase subunit of ABC transporter with duplicated ATPase domains